MSADDPNEPTQDDSPEVDETTSSDVTTSVVLEDKSPVKEAKTLGEEDDQSSQEDESEEENEDESEEDEDESEEDEDDDEIEIVDEEDSIYQAKGKPTLTGDVIQALALKKIMQKKRPEFRRQEWHRYKRLGTAWRKPKGLHSKQRRNLKYRSANVSIGYGSPRLARGLHPSGFEEILIHNLAELESLDNQHQAARIAHGVGTRKRDQIHDKAEELGIRVLNRRK